MPSDMSDRADAMLGAGRLPLGLGKAFSVSPWQPTGSKAVDSHRKLSSQRFSAPRNVMLFLRGTFGRSFLCSQRGGVVKVPMASMVNQSSRGHT